MSDPRKVRRLTRYDAETDCMPHCYGGVPEFSADEYQSKPWWKPDDPSQWCRSEDVARLEDENAAAIDVLRRGLEDLICDCFADNEPCLRCEMEREVAKAEGWEEKA